MAGRRQTYEEEAYEYYRETWRRLAAARASRRLLIRAGTLASLGGVSALNSLLAACAAGRQEQELVQKVSEAGTYKYSRYPLVEKYNWRNLPKPGTPYIGGHGQRALSPPSHWDLLTQGISTPFPPFYNGLLHMRHDFEANLDGFDFETDMATSFEHAPDFSSWTFHLHWGVRFHDIPPVNGRECTAEDWVYSLTAFMDPKKSLWAVPLQFVERVTAPDRYTVRFEMKRPIFYLPAVLSSPYYQVFAREHYEGDQDHWKNQPIGTGAFKVTYSRIRDKVDSVRHPAYFGKDAGGRQLPYLDRYTGIFFADAAASKAAFRSGQIDVIYAAGDYVSLQDILSTNPESIVQVTPQAPDFHTLFLFQHSNPVFQDVRVRRAFSMAIDRKAMIEQLTGGAAVPAYPVPYDLMGLTEPLVLEECGPYWQYNPTEARRLLEEAGYKDGLEVEFLTTSPVPDSVLLLQKYLEAVGVRLRLVEQESTVVTAARTNKTFRGMISGSAIPGLDVDLAVYPLFAPGSALNWGNVDDPVLTELLERIRFSLDQDERTRLAKQVNDRVLDQVHHLWIFSVHDIVIMHPWVRNYVDALHTWVSNWGSWAWRIVWLTDHAPAGRGGRLAT